MTGEVEYIVTYSDLYLDIGERICVSGGGMVTILASVSNIGDLKFLGGLNVPRGRLGGINNNSNRGTPNKKIKYPCILLLIFYL